MYHYKPIITVKGRQKHVSLGVPCDTTFGSKFLIPWAEATDLEARKRATTVYLVSRQKDLGLPTTN